MTHFLGRLVERTRGTTTLVEPLIAPRFAVVDSLGAENFPEIPTPDSPPTVSPPEEARRGQGRIQTRSVNEQPGVRSDNPLEGGAKDGVVTDTRSARQRANTLPVDAHPMVHPENARNEEARVAALNETLLVLQEVRKPEGVNERVLGSHQVEMRSVEEELTPQPNDARDEETKVEVLSETLLVPQFEKKPQSLVVRQSDRQADVAKKAHGTARTRPGVKPIGQRRNLRQSPRGPAPDVYDEFGFPKESPAQPPVVHVTIGRIEVRAMPAPTPPPRKAVAPTPPMLTLDAYLKARKEGAR